MNAGQTEGSAYSQVTRTSVDVQGRRRRSVLFVPGSNARAIEKSRASDADCLVLDLEDMVPDEHKPAARALVAAEVAAGGFGDRELVIRVNGLDTQWGRDDIAAVAAVGAHAMLVPKVSSVADIGSYLSLIDAGGGSARDLWVLAETSRAILDLDQICASTPRLKAIVLGTQDLIKALRMQPDEQRVGLAPVLSHAVVCARAHGLSVIDGVYIAVKDEAGFAAICRQGTAFGFDGKALIHPNQVAPANVAFN